MCFSSPSRPWPIFLTFIPIWGRLQFWLYTTFQMGWNHQLGLNNGINYQPQLVSGISEPSKATVPGDWTESSSWSWRSLCRGSPAGRRVVSEGYAWSTSLKNPWLEDEFPFGFRSIFRGELLVSGNVVYDRSLHEIHETRKRGGGVTRYWQVLFLYIITLHICIIHEHIGLLPKKYGSWQFILDFGFCMFFFKHVHPVWVQGSLGC